VRFNIINPNERRFSFVLHDCVNILRDRDKFQDIRAISRISAILSHVLYVVSSRQKKGNETQQIVLSS